MSELIEFYHQEAISKISSIPWVSEIQQRALLDFQRLGFPTRKDEEWKYTSVDAFSRERFSSIRAPITHYVHDTNVPVSCNQIQIINGVVITPGTLIHKLPTGVVIQPLSQAIIEHGDKLQPYLGKIIQHEHGFQALNTAMAHSGVFIYLPAGVNIGELLLSHWQDSAHSATYIRHIIVAEAGSAATIIEDYQGLSDTIYFTNSITEVHMASNATLTHYKIQRESNLAYHCGHLAVNQQHSSHVNSHMFSFGGKLARNDVSFNLQEPFAHCSMNGIYAPNNGQHMDHHTRVLHSVADCNSFQDYKGILNSHARAVFNGKVIVAKDAQHTEARQHNKNILLSTDAEINTKPQMEIFANDVVCTHGATVGQLDEDALFYLATRGISPAEARGYLIHAFAIDNLRAVTNVNLSAWIGDLLTQQIGGL